MTSRTERQKKVVVLLFFLFCGVFSSCGHALRQHVRLPGLGMRGFVSRGGLWPGHAVVPALHPLFICLLVQTAVWGIQVSCDPQG